MDRNESPYVAHVFVCTNDRGGARKSCADNNSPAVKAELKAAINDNGWKGKIRVSTSGCLGLCAQGSNVLIYPQRIWFADVSPGDVGEIVAVLESCMS